jgi:Lon protease-like protein
VTIPDRGQASDQRQAVAARLRGYAEVEQLRRAELQAMTEEEAAEIADELQQLLPLLPEEPERGSGLVEQQRLFSRARR